MHSAVRVQNLGKSYRLGITHAGSVRELVNRATSRVLKRKIPAPRPIVLPEQADRVDDTGLFWALRNVSFEVQQGAIVGLVGRNGAGKSTLLKILSRITLPTTGRIELHGRGASLLEVATGFHPELTGRENVYLNGAILGMTRSEVRRQFDAIVAFAEIDRFIDTPVKRYSSGMHVRLGFAVAAHLQAEILFVDEVLAVGDASFQQKCLSKMSDLGHDGRTVLFVSHNMAAIRQLTNECVVVDEGKLLFRGPTEEAVDRYLDRQKTAARTTSNVLDLPRVSWCGDRSIEFVTAELNSPVNHRLPLGEDLKIGVSVRANEYVGSFSFSITLYTHDGVPLSTAFGDPIGSIDGGASRSFQLTIPAPDLAPGEYWLSLSILRSARILVDVIHEVLHFEVLPDGRIPTGFLEWNRNWGNMRMTLEADESCSTPRDAAAQ